VWFFPILNEKAELLPVAPKIRSNLEANLLSCLSLIMETKISPFLWDRREYLAKISAPTLAFLELI
jgi:hypothetical protein